MMPSFNILTGRHLYIVEEPDGDAAVLRSELLIDHGTDLTERGRLAIDHHCLEASLAVPTDAERKSGIRYAAYDEDEEEYWEDHDLPIITCTCGDWGCAGVLPIRVTRGADAVVWTLRHTEPETTFRFGCAEYEEFVARFLSRWKAALEKHADAIAAGTLTVEPR